MWAFQLHTESESTESIVSELSVDAKGVGRSTIRGVARMVGVSDMALIQAFQSANLNPSKLAVMLINAGFTPANLASFSQDGVSDTAIAVIAEYLFISLIKSTSGKASKDFRGIGSCRFLRQLLDIRSIVYITSNFDRKGNLKLSAFATTSGCQADRLRHFKP